MVDEAQPAALRLARIKQFVTDDARMTEWDSWRRYIAGGGGASWPRDAFECVLDWVAEECGTMSADSAQTQTALPPEAEGFAAVNDDGKFDPDLIYSDCPEDWSKAHGKPVWRVKIIP